MLKHNFVQQKDFGVLNHYIKIIIGRKGLLLIVIFIQKDLIKNYFFFGFLEGFNPAITSDFVGMIIQRIRYAITPEKAIIARTIAIALINTGSTSKYSASPPQTPPRITSFSER